MKYPRVTVIWDDACSSDPWQEADKIDPSPKRCYTTGYMIKRTKDAIVISHTVSDDGDACCVITIPVKMAKVIRKVVDK
jgi:hypothetical protein